MNYKYNKYIKDKSYSRLFNYINFKDNHKFDIIISIPCYNEFEYLFKTLDSINKQNKNILKSTLVSITINNSIHESKNIINNNNNTLKKIKKSKYDFCIVVIDAFSKNNALSIKEAGVGVARKIAVDSILHLTHSKSIIAFIDADTILSDDYLQTILSTFNKYRIGASTVNFEHIKDEPKTIKIIEEYEKFLKDTARDLKKSLSPYHYVPLGSTMICTQEKYITIGGMNKRKAAEDFYFLQELQKNNDIYFIDRVLVFPSSRCLNRSYLGTSTRLRQCIDGKLKISNLYFSKKSFHILKQWIQIALQLHNK